VGVTEGHAILVEILCSHEGEDLLVVDRGQTQDFAQFEEAARQTRHPHHLLSDTEAGSDHPLEVVGG
jgi:hypothetical protein